MEPTAHASPANVVPGGLLVAFEGVDGAGKTTQAIETCKALQELGYEAVYLKEPSDGPIGRKLREMMVSKVDRDYQEEFELFLQDRQHDVEQNIQPVLKRGGIVCIDRYYISSMAYQGALGLDPGYIRNENEKIAPQPDLILYFSLPLEESLRRILQSRDGGQNQFELREYQERVQTIFEQMDFAQMKRIDASAPPDIVQGNVMERVMETLRSKTAGGL